MSERTIYITETDYTRLKNLISETYRVELRRTEYLENLEKELSRAVIVSADKIPADVITMNSKAILLDAETNEEMTFTLVYPDDADMEDGKISIFAPIGTAMIGYRVGNFFEWAVPDGIRRIKILRVVYQPEASGNFEE